MIGQSSMSSCMFYFPFSIKWILIIDQFSWVDRDMFMRYLGGGIGHLNQGAIGEDHMDVDSDLETGEDSDEAGMTDDLDLEVNEGHSQKNNELLLQNLHILATEVSSRPADEDDEDDIHSESESDSENNSSDHDLDLFDETEEQDEDEDFGPEDGERELEDDDGFGSF